MADNFHGDGFFEWQRVKSDGGKVDMYHFDKQTQWGGFAPEDERGENVLPDWAIGPFERYPGNPVFSPDPDGWDIGRFGGGVHNGAVIAHDGYIYYIYRGEFETPKAPKFAAQLASGIDYHCDIGLARSRDGVRFERVAGPFFRHDDDEIYSFEDVCCVKEGGRFYIYLNRWNWARHNDPQDSGIICAVSDDLIHWENIGLLFPNATRIHRNPCVLQDNHNRPVRDAQGRYVMYINDGLIAYSADLIHWESTETGHFWPGGEGCFALANHDASRPGDIVLFTGGNHTGHFYAVGEVLLSLKDPAKPLEWLEYPVLTAAPAIPHENGQRADAPHDVISPFADTIFFTGMTMVDGKRYAYYGGSEVYTCLAMCDK